MALLTPHPPIGKRRQQALLAALLPLHRLRPDTGLNMALLAPKSQVGTVTVQSKAAE